MTYEDNWGDTYAPREQLQRESESETELAALRREVAALKDMFAEKMDVGEEAVVADNRRALLARAEREAKAADAATDPATLEALRNLDTKEEVTAFLKDRGMGG